MEKENIELLNPNDEKQDIDKKFIKGQFTIDDFLQGKFYHIPNKRLVLDELDRKYENITKDNTFLTKIYHLDKKHIMVHVQVPSEKIEDMFYDVLIEFNNYGQGQPIKSINAKFFSNSPSFIFTYAFLFNSKHLLIEGAKSLVEDRKAFTVPPIRNNYYNIISFDKSLYFACKYIIDNYGDLSELEVNASKEKFSFSNIRTAEEILLEYKDKKKRESYKKKHDKELNKKNKLEDFASRNSQKLKDKINDNKTLAKQKSASNIISKIRGKNKIRGKRKIK